MNKDNTIDKELDEILLNFRIATDSAMIGEDASAYTEAKTAKGIGCGVILISVGLTCHQII